MKSNDIAHSMHKPIFRFYSTISVISFALICISPLLWIWDSWSNCWRTFLTGLIINVIVMNLSKITLKTLQKKISDEILEHESHKDEVHYQKSLFYKRIETIINSNK
jgi:hypothetical protein